MEPGKEGFGPLKIASPKKRELTLLLKELHGDIWGREIHPRFDKRGLASVYLLRYNNCKCIEAIIEHPIYRLQLDILKDAEIEELQSIIPIIIKATGRYLEFLQIDYVADTTINRTKRLREVLPKSGSIFRDMPHLSSVVFSHVNFSNSHMKALCTNPTLTSVDLRDCAVTKSIAKSLVNCKKLEYLLLEQCEYIPRDLTDWFRAKLPQTRIVRISQ